jgi:3-phosphoshikimate 1-carboxyvinyltransferase
MIKEIRPAALRGRVSVPASKSHTIRAILLGSLAEGESTVTGPLESADTRSCITACRSLGAVIEEDADGSLMITGTGGKPVPPPGHTGGPVEIDAGNSGTTLYLAASAAALADFPVLFTGDDQLRSRPTGPLLQALTDLGAEAVSLDLSGNPPVRVNGPLRGGETAIECPTSQFLSSLLIAAPLAGETSVITVPLLNEKPYVDMTLAWMRDLGIDLEQDGYRRFSVPGGQKYRSFEKRIPGDFSSATFFFCAAAVTGSDLFIEGLDMEDTQGDKAIVKILESMGCPSEVAPEGMRVLGSRASRDGLEGIEIDLNDTPDALPALAALACYAEGETRLVNVPQARLKETDRITVMREELSKMGADVEELPDGLVVRGRGAASGRGAAADGHSVRLHGARLDGRGDHRVVMALAVAALGAAGPSLIDTAETVDITFPGFFAVLDALTMGGAAVDPAGDRPELSPGGRS